MSLPKTIEFVQKIPKIWQIFNESFEESQKKDSNQSQIPQKVGFDTNHRIRIMIRTEHYSLADLSTLTEVLG